MKKVVIAGSLLLLISVLVVYFYVYKKPARTAASDDAAFSLTVNELVSAFETDENMANSKYLNQIILVSGTVAEVTESDNDISVNLREPDGMAGVTCSFEKNSLNKTQVTTGFKVFIKGICSGYLMDVVLNKCVLEQSPPE